MKRRVLSLCAFSIAAAVLIFPQTALVQAPETPQASQPTLVRKPAARKPNVEFPPVPVFEEIAREVGLTVSHISTEEKRYIVESMSGGVGLFDCDNDGRLDIVLVNGSTIENFRKGGDPLVTLYHQEPDGKFKDITADARLTRRGWGMGVAVADFDNDGNLDLYVTGYNDNALYRNLGNCKFEDVTDKAGVHGGGFSTGAAWGDYDRDGFVDLFVSRYVHVDLEHLPEFGSNKDCRYQGIPVQCGPRGLDGEGDLLFHNRGDGTFEEVSRKAGVQDPKGYNGLGVMWVDYDDDGWPDLFVANDATPNYLYHNNHNGTFTDVGLTTGVALSGDGVEMSSMGVDFADYDHSGRLSLFATEFAEAPNFLARNIGGGSFDDVSWKSAIAQPSFPYVGWGTSFFDMDNDGWPDIFVANGHVYPQADSIKSTGKYRQPLLLHRNRRDGTFDEVSKAAGLRDLPMHSSRGAAFGDIFNDGNIDVVVLNVGEPPSLLRNENHDGNHRVLFRLTGTKSNRAAIGARVTIHSGGMTQFQEVRGSASYLSQNDLRLHFGLGQATTIESVEIRWPNSEKIEKLQSLKPDAIYTIVEGQGIRETTALARP
jgi:enediyne biosynthesis protein E4